MKKNIFQIVINLVLITIGSAIFAAAVSLLLEPFDIVPGGITGVAMLIHHGWDRLSLGTLALLLNIPLFILSFIFLGRKFLLYTAYGTVISSVMINLTARFEPLFTPDSTQDVMLVAVAGGVMMGIGLGLVFMRGATTGGSDIIARLAKLIFPHIQIGKLMFAFDALLVLASILVFGDISVGLYATIVIFIASRVMDMMLYGMNIERVAYIISESHGEISREISDRLDRGCTFLHGTGSYTGKQRNVVMCAIKRQQVSLLKNIVKSIDPDAFLIVTEAHEILGEGFKDYDKNAL